MPKFERISQKSNLFRPEPDDRFTRTILLSLLLNSLSMPILSTSVGAIDGVATSA
jgi:hypothetical protein